MILPFSLGIQCIAYLDAFPARDLHLLPKARGTCDGHWRYPELTNPRVNESMKNPKELFAHVQELRNRFEPLREELLPYVEETRFGYFIRHPFCNSSVFDLDHCGLIHEEIDIRTAQADACFEAQDWEGWLDRISDCDKPDWFAKDAEFFPDDRYWTVLRMIHETAKNTYPDRGLFDQLFRSARPGRENLMTAAERRVLAMLPDVLTVYRGYSDDENEGFADGISWTLSRQAAIWHANSNRIAESPRLIIGTIQKGDIWAYMDGGDLFLPPEAVYDKRDQDAWCKKARRAWSKFMTKPFDVRKLFPAS